MLFFFFFNQKTAYEMRISDWSSDVCSSDLSISQGSWEDQDRGRNSCPPARSLPTRNWACREYEAQQYFQLDRRPSTAPRTPWPRCSQGLAPCMAFPLAPDAACPSDRKSGV